MDPEWVHGDDVGMPGVSWMSREEYLKRLESATQLIPTVAPAPPVNYPWTEPTPRAAGGWRVARSLDTLLAQLNQRAPGRSKVSDGSIGDAAHASRDSDHNPWYGPGIVTARDYTHDPAGGLDGNWLANTLVAGRDPRIKYVIWNRRIIDSRPGSNPWVWMPYTGTNPHDHHVHLSVMPNASCDDTRPWAIGGVTPAPVVRNGADPSIWTRREKPWKGGISNIPDPVKGEEYDLFMYGLRNNVLGYQATLMLESLLDLVADLRVELAAVRAAVDD